jgi:hypothetical protein
MSTWLSEPVEASLEVASMGAYQGKGPDVK